MSRISFFEFGLARRQSVKPSIRFFLGMALWLPLTWARSADSPLFSDALSPDWQNWSWSSTVNLSNTSPVHSGSRSIAIKHDAAWAALYLHSELAFSTTEFDRVSFWIHGGSTGHQQIALVVNGDVGHHYPITAPVNSWVQVTVPFSLLGNPSSVSDMYWQDASGTVQPLFYLDDIQLLASNAPPPPPPVLSIDVGASRHAISDTIYGMNFAEESLASELRLPVRRWGGNSTTRYNWKTSMTNAASDWFFENVPEDVVNLENLPNGSASDQFVEQNRRTGTRTLMTVPLIGWTAKTTSPRNHPFDCAFKVSEYGPQQAVDHWDTDCGNGVRNDGSLIGGNDPLETSEAIDTPFVKDWVTHLVGRYGVAANHGVEFYNLDNEPMLWNSTHRDIHPQPVSYDELRDRTFRYAAAIKDIDPSAKTLGPVPWGWCAYLYSARDGCSPGADYNGHGGQLFIPWYLDQMRSYEQSHSKRILDYLDLHYYPQANGVSLALAGSASTQALRLRSTRALWDPNYKDESWISDTEDGGVRVQLIPRMRQWVNASYPGTRLAISEYNWGGLEDINGALAQADVLGIFGRENLDLATLWSPPSSGQPGAFAFRMYRNYDGNGNGFGDESLSATSSNQEALAIYAAQRRPDNALTVIVINKSGGNLASPLNMTGASLPASAAVYRYSKENLAAIVKLPDQAITNGGFNAVYPANSITLFVVSQPASQAPLTVSATPASLISGGAGSTLSTVGGSTGGAVTFSATASSGLTCTISGITLTAIGGAGTCSVTATMAGNANYGPVTSAVLDVPVVGGVLTGLAAQGYVGTNNQVQFGAFTIQGDSRRVLIRGLGPALDGYVPNAIRNPKIALSINGELRPLEVNDDWADADNADEIATLKHQPKNPSESAILRTLEPGVYNLHLSGSGGSTGIGMFQVYAVEGGGNGELKGLAAQGQVGTGNQVQFGAFTITGAPRKVLIRGLGPALNGYVPGPLENPQIALSVNGADTPIETNDDWGLADNADEIAVLKHQPKNPTESAILRTLEPGIYNVHLSGSGGSTGIGMFQVYTVQ